MRNHTRFIALALASTVSSVNKSFRHLQTKKNILPVTNRRRVTSAALGSLVSFAPAIQASPLPKVAAVEAISDLPVKNSRVVVAQRSQQQNSQDSKAEVAEIKNPSWREVPGTKMHNDNQELQPAAVDVNGITRKGNILTYDLVNPNTAYERLQTNCQSGKLRGIRQGDFQSSTRVRYWAIVNSWEKATSSYDRALVKFVCSL